MIQSPIYTLQQRHEFLEGVRELTRLCDWTEEEASVLLEQVWQELVGIDNTTFDTLIKTGNQEAAHLVWEKGMEETRYWLSLILGIKIKFI